MQQIYKTRQRETILAFLREHADGCFSAREIRRALGDAIGEATVYRTLELLKQSGEVQRFRPDGGKSATYQYATANPACAHHLHLKCRACGELYHLECSHLQPLWEHLEGTHGFSVSQADTILYGVCRACQEAGK